MKKYPLKFFGKLVLASSIISFGIGVIPAYAQVYNPTVASQQAQVQQILALVNSLPSYTNEQLTQKIQLLQQALQLQLAVNSATGYSTNYNNNAGYNNNNSALYGTGNGSNLNNQYNNNYGNQYGNTLTGSYNTPVFISTLYPSTGNIGTRINLQGNNIAVNDQIQILPPINTFGYTAGQYISAGVVDPGLGFTFPATLSICNSGYNTYNGACLSQSQTIPVVTGSYGVRIMKPDGYTVSNTQYFQVNTSATSNYNNNNNYNGSTWAMPASSFALTASSFNPTSVILSWPNATNSYGSNYFRLLEILPNNQMNSITTTSNRTYQIDNLIAGSVHTYVVYGCTDSACNQVLSQSVPVVVSLLANANGNNGLGAIASTVTTQATSITGTSATLNGQVNTYPGYNYGAGSIQTWFEYAINLNNTGTVQRTNQVSNSFSPGTVPVNASVFYLQSNTLYQYRLVAIVNGGTPVYGPINTFYTSYY